MPFTRAGQLARPTPTARPDDPLGLVAENLRVSTCATLPILDRLMVTDDPRAPQNRGARVVGIVEERDLSRAVLPALARERRELPVYAQRPPAAPPPIPDVTPARRNGYSANGAGPSSEPNGVGPHAAGPAHAAGEANSEFDLPRAVADLTARLVMRHDFGIVPAAFTLENALHTLDRYDSSALPVVDDAGGYLGMISRADVVAALGRQVRPPTVGGMATPLGVWLTTGFLSGGAPPLGLFLSGLTLAGCLMVAHLVLLIGLSFANPSWAAMFESGRIAFASGPDGPALDAAMGFLETLLFLLALRSVPMSGIHAAEHQTVWAIERGLPLTPEFVATMPRAHPRCGTNLATLAGLITIVFTHLPAVNSATVIVALLFVYVVWRACGTFIQEKFTTRPASLKQLESGIRAGKAVIEAYQEQPHAQASFGAGLFNSGLALCAAGMYGGMAVYQYLEIYVARLVLR